MKPVSYLDYNATSPLRPEALAAMTSALTEIGNPSSVHGFGRLARRHLDLARQQVAALVRTKPENVIFTSGGTEANNLALLNCGDRRLLVSAIEHDSIMKPARQMGAEIIQVQRSGEIDLDHLEALLRQPGAPALVSIMLANNETGVIQPVTAVSGLVHLYGGVLLVYV